MITTALNAFQLARVHLTVQPGEQAAPESTRKCAQFVKIVLFRFSSYFFLCEELKTAGCRNWGTSLYSNSDKFYALFLCYLYLTQMFSLFPLPSANCHPRFIALPARHRPSHQTGPFHDGHAAGDGLQRPAAQPAAAEEARLQSAAHRQRAGADGRGRPE